MNQYHYQNLLKRIQQVLEEGMPTSSPKTMGKKDFTGYPIEKLAHSLALLDSLGELPSPLVACRKALEGSLAALTVASELANEAEREASK